jgi:hypothetical protein
MDGSRMYRIANEGVGRLQRAISGITASKELLLAQVCLQVRRVSTVLPQTRTLSLQRVVPGEGWCLLED